MVSGGSSAVAVRSILTWAQYFVHNAITPRVTTNPENLFRVNTIFNDKISHWQGDITSLEVDAVVNAANSQLQAGGGVDGAIHARAGEDLQNSLNELNGCEVGEAVITPGFGLPAKYVIHTVGPQEINEKQLSNSYKASYRRFLEAGLRTIAFPCISTGIYGYPKEAAAHTALRETRQFLETNSDKVDRIIFCTFTEEDKSVYDELLPRYFPVVENPENIHTIEELEAALSQLPEETRKRLEPFCKPNQVTVKYSSL